MSFSTRKEGPQTKRSRPPEPLPQGVQSPPDPSDSPNGLTGLVFFLRLMFTELGRTVRASVVVPRSPIHHPSGPTPLDDASSSPFGRPRPDLHQTLPVGRGPGKVPCTTLTGQGRKGGITVVQTLHSCGTPFFVD